MATTSRSADLTSGPMLQKIILFSVPLAASSILQLLFNAADVVVVGALCGQHGAGRRGLQRRVDQPAGQPVRRAFAGCQCGGSPVLWRPGRKRACRIRCTPP